MSNEEVKKPYEPVPENDYKLRMEKWELKDTKSGTGKYLNCMFEVMSGDFKGKKIFEK